MPNALRAYERIARAAGNAIAVNKTQKNNLNTQTNYTTILFLILDNDTGVIPKKLAI